jgi:hypothetical protein
MVPVENFQRIFLAAHYDFARGRIRNFSLARLSK